MNYFEILQYIGEEEFAVDMDYQKWKNVLGGELAEWNEEVELMSVFKHYFGELLRR